MRRLIIGFALAAPVIFIALLWRAPWIGLGVLALSHALILYPTLSPNVQWLGPVITRFDATDRELWLTIDDGPTDDTSALLDLLAAHAVPATFFVKGELAESKPAIVREIVGRGHTVGNHSHTHPSGTFWCLPPRAVADEIERCQSALQSIAGDPPSLFRAPVGMKNPFVHPALNRCGLRLIGWTIRSFDAVKSDAGAIASDVERHLEPGAILVLHQGREWSLRVVERVITIAASNGYRFVIPDSSRLKTKR